jgi:hypothetical protein
MPFAKAVLSIIEVSALFGTGKFRGHDLWRLALRSDLGVAQLVFPS